MSRVADLSLARAKRAARGGMGLERRDELSDEVRQPVALTLNEVCRRLGVSRRTAERLLAHGQFPVPALPRIGRSHWRFSSSDLNHFLLNASTADARVRRRRG